MTRFVPALLSFFALASLGVLAETREWEFEMLEPDWKREASSPDAPKTAVNCADGKVAITARANTWDRVKITTVARDFGPGVYRWRVFVPAMGMNDMASVAGFIYQDDKHELDFEIGSGTAKVRKELNAAPDEVICYCTNQAFPYASSPYKIQGNAWHTLSLQLTPRADGKLTVRWAIDGKIVKELNSELPAATRFGIHCSVENLKFLGDHQPTRDHVALFDKVTFTPAAK